jgi:quercetin dioxygenase-like cupin family protein
MVTHVLGIPESFHSASSDLPWAADWAGDPRIKLKLLMADIEGGRFAVRMLFEPGTQVFPHKHTGEVHAFTLAGKWAYIDYPDSPSNTAGSYLFEPPGSTHTLKVADDAPDLTDVIFIIYGAMLHLDLQGNVVAVTDAENVQREYPQLLRQQGQPVPRSLPIGGSMSYRPCL